MLLPKKVEFAHILNLYLEYLVLSDIQNILISYYKLSKG